MKVKALLDFGKGLIAFFAALLSVLLGLGLAIASFDLAVFIQVNLWLILPCLFVAGLSPVFLVFIPGYIYWWRFGFPEVPRRSKSLFLVRYIKSLPF